MTTKDISTGLKVIIFIIPGVWAVLSVVISVSWIGAQTTEKLDNTAIKVEKVETKLEDTIKMREETSVKVGKMETKIEILDKKMDKLDDKLDKILDRLP